MDQEWPTLRIGMPEQQAEQPSEDFAYKLEFEEVKEAQELLGLYSDLDYVVKLTELLASILRQRQGEAQEDTGRLRDINFGENVAGANEHVARALWEAALVAYARCFTTGKRGRLDEGIFEAQPEHMLTWHRYFKNTRDKHVAHSVNPFEMVITGAYVTDHETHPRVDGVVNVYVTKSGEAVETVEYMGRHAAWVRDVVEQRRKIAAKKVWDKASSLSPDEVRCLRVLEEMPQQGFDAAGKVRR